jgi:hypothetical protein
MPLQEEIYLGIGQAVDLGLGDIAAHADDVHLQANAAPAQQPRLPRLPQPPRRRR